MIMPNTSGGRRSGKAGSRHDAAGVSTGSAPPAKQARAMGIHRGQLRREAAQQVIHGGALAGVPEAYDVLMTGVADISAIIPQDVEKPFPLNDIPTLPFLSSVTGPDATKAWFDSLYMKGYLDEEYGDMKVILLYLGAGDDFLSTKPVNSIADLKGLKVCTGGGIARIELLKQTGGVSVFAPPPEVYTALQKGTAEAVHITGMGIGEFHWDEFVQYMIQPLRMGRMTTLVGLNMDVYNKMPDDVKAMIDDKDAVRAFSVKAVQAFVDEYDNVIKNWYAAGAESIEWSPEALAELDALMAPAWENWIAEKEAQGVPAREAIDEFYNGLKALGADKPFIGYTPGG